MCTTSIQPTVVEGGMMMPYEGHLRRKNVRFNLQENRVCYFRENIATIDLCSSPSKPTNMCRWSSAAEKDSHRNFPKMPRRDQNIDCFASAKGVTENVPRMPIRRNNYTMVNQQSAARAA